MTDGTRLSEVTDGARDAGRALRMALNALDARGQLDEPEYADLVHRLRSALAYTEAAYHEARRHQRG